jgi:peptidoglycan/LPS O-acetylase OafA/YrhL
VDSPDPRNRLILRRTLSAIAWIWALWSALLGAPIVLFPDHDVRLRGWLLLGHAVLLAAAGVGLWKPRRWGWATTALAALAGVGFAVAAFAGGHSEAGAVDALFPICAAGIWLQAREPRLDRDSGQG